MSNAELLALAEDARAASYSPYSHFAVGAALETPDGRTFTGANVENASYGLSMCAERVAIYRALHEGERSFVRVAVSGPDGVLTMPCGACRQVLSEFGPDLEVIVRDGGAVTSTSLRVLLPGAFGPASLDIARSIR